MSFRSRMLQRIATGPFYSACTVVRFRFPAFRPKNTFLFEIGSSIAQRYASSYVRCRLVRRLFLRHVENPFSYSFNRLTFVFIRRNQNIHVRKARVIIHFTLSDISNISEGIIKTENQRRCDSIKNQENIVIFVSWVFSSFIVSHVGQSLYNQFEPVFAYYENMSFVLTVSTY